MDVFVVLARLQDEEVYCLALHKAVEALVDLLNIGQLLREGELGVCLLHQLRELTDGHSRALYVGVESANLAL